MPPMKNKKEEILTILKEATNTQESTVALEILVDIRNTLVGINATMKDGVSSMPQVDA